MSRKSEFKRYIPYQSDFSHYCACWARNHRGWCKMKKDNRKLAKLRMRRSVEKEVQEYNAWEGEKYGN